jgi:adenylate cyclase
VSFKPFGEAVLSPIRKLRVFIRRRSYPLRPTLVSAVVIAIILTIASIGIPGYLSSKKSVRLLWDEVGKNIAERSTEYVTQYFQDAPHLTDFITGLCERKELDITNSHQMMDVSYEGLHDNPHFVLFCLANVDGSTFGAYRNLLTGELVGRLGMIKQDAPDLVNKTYSQDFKLENGRWVVAGDLWSDYDARKRPWWPGAVQHPGGNWSEPYLFYDQPRRIGITFTQAQIVDEKIIGYWTVDYQTDYLHDYVKKLVQGTSGRILIINESGQIIADSKTQDLLALRSIKDVVKNNPWLEPLWENPQELKLKSGGFEVDDYFVYIDKFSPAPRLNWSILSIVDKSDFFGPIDKAAWLAVAIALPLCLFLIILSAVFFGRISQRLKELAFEMNLVGNLHFTPKLFSETPSFVREVNMMSDSLDRMKAGLNSFSKYVPKDLVFELIKSGEEAVLGGKKMELTLLFTDLANFTRLSEQAPPDLLIQILGEYLSEMTHIVEAQKGVVDLYIGDSVFAFWGAPEPIKEHAFLACRAALLMRAKFELLWKDVPTQYRSMLKQRIGINTGTVIVGNIGSKDRLSYSAIGDAVNLASRLEGLNKFYSTSILIGEETAKIVENEFILRPVDWVAVKGRDRATLIYELVGEKGSADDQVLQAIAVYREALDLYRRREFLKSAERFEEANRLLGGGDFASQKLAERSREYQKIPPPEGWTGSMIMQEK